MSSTVDEARAAWATASRDDELTRWRELYDKAVPHTTLIVGAAPRHEADMEAGQ